MPPPPTTEIPGQPPRPETNAVRQVRPVRADRADRPHVAEPGHRRSAAVVLGRPPRRQPGADRPDGPGAQAAHVRGPREDGLQGDRGRVPGGQPAGLRLHPPADHRRPDPRRRDDPGVDAVPPRAHRAHLREHPGGAAGDRPLLQLDQPAAAPGRVRSRPSRHRRHRRQRRQALPQAGAAAPQLGDPLRVLAGELHAHRARLRRRDLRAGDGRHRARRRPPDHPQPAGHGRVLLAQRVRRRHRVVRAHDHAAAATSCFRCIRTTTEAAPWPPPSSG